MGDTELIFPPGHHWRVVYFLYREQLLDAMKTARLTHPGISARFRNRNWRSNMANIAPKTLAEAEVWFAANAKKADHISDFGGDIDGGGVYAGTLLQLEFGNDFDAEIVNALTSAHPGAWARK